MIKLGLSENKAKALMRFYDLTEKISILPVYYQNKFRSLGFNSLLLAPFIDQEKWEIVIRILDIVNENTSYGELYRIIKRRCY